MQLTSAIVIMAAGTVILAAYHARARRLLRRAGVIAAVAVAAAALTSTAATAGVPAGQPARPARPAHPAPGRAAVTGAARRAAAQTPATAPCFGESFPDCASSDPNVHFTSVSVGDTTGCTFQDVVDWGDKHTGTYDFSGGADGSTLENYDHLYGSRGHYTIVITATTTGGSCSSTGATLEFTLKAVSVKLRQAALGDSYSSGEGAGDYYAASGGCHRSPLAWAVQLDTYLPRHDASLSRTDFLACSGAESKNLEAESFKGERPQIRVLEKLLPRPTLVTMTMGGNDLGFSRVLEDCFTHNCVSDGTLADVTDMLPAEERTLAGDYADLRLAVPSATVLILGYPQIFEQDHWCNGTKPVLGFSVAEEKGLNELTDRVDASIARAAATAGVSYVRVTDAVRGHELCTRHPWIYDTGFGTRNDQQAGHPTAPGQRAIAKIAAAYIDSKL